MPVTFHNSGPPEHQRVEHEPPEEHVFQSTSRFSDFLNPKSGQAFGIRTLPQRSDVRRISHSLTILSLRRGVPIADQLDLSPPGLCLRTARFAFEHMKFLLDQVECGNRSLGLLIGITIDRIDECLGPAEGADISSERIPKQRP